IHVASENWVESRIYPVRREVYRDCLPSPFVFLHAGVERTLPCDRLRIDQPGGQGLQALRPERVDQVRHGQDIMCLMPGPLETRPLNSQLSDIKLRVGQHDRTLIGANELECSAGPVIPRDCPAGMLVSDLDEPDAITLR